MKTNVNTEFSRNNKDNIGTATLLAVSLFAVASGLFNSAPADASNTAIAVVQKLDPIVVTAPRIAQRPHTTLTTIVVTASRNVSHA